MSLRIMLISAALVSGLSACDTKPTEIGPGAADRNAPKATSTPLVSVELPPAISASKQYRCSDNSLAFVDFYSDGASASIKTERDGKAVRLKAPNPGETMVAEGYSLKGGKSDEKVTITTPAHRKPLSCHV